MICTMSSQRGVYKRQYLQLATSGGERVSEFTPLNDPTQVDSEMLVTTLRGRLACDVEDEALRMGIEPEEAVQLMCSAFLQMRRCIEDGLVGPVFLVPSPTVKPELEEQLAVGRAAKGQEILYQPLVEPDQSMPNY
jgi:hypothetical protein